jgi:hypothetical protein
MAEKNYQDAVQALKDRLSGRWEGAELAGRDEMVKTLKDRLGYDNRAANDAIDAMIAAGTLRYHRAREVGGTPEAIPAPVTPSEATGLPASGGLAGTPLAPGVIPAFGYWQIGEDQDEAPPGRGGQVRVDY